MGIVHGAQRNLSTIGGRLGPLAFELRNMTYIEKRQRDALIHGRESSPV